MVLKNNPSHLRTLREKLMNRLPESRGMVQAIRENNPEYDDLAQIPASLISFLCNDEDEKLAAVIEGYIAFSDTFKQKQYDFVRKGNYAHTDFDTVNNQVYQDTQYMMSVYYPALLCSYLFSPNYFDILRVFTSRFVPKVAGKSGQLCEIGIGHGLLSAYLLRNAPDVTGVGLDISPSASKMTETVGRYFNLEPFVKVQVTDAIVQIPMFTGEPYSVIICAELLEHLAEPEKLLHNVHSVLANDGLFFLTASINMESVDHLYLFRAEDEVRCMVEACGFCIVESYNAFLSSQPYRRELAISEKLMRQKNPATVILLLEKSRSQ